MDLLKEILALDEKIFLILNQIHSPFFDQLMILISSKFTWIPFYIIILYMIWVRKKKQIIFVVLFITSSIIFSDQISSGLMKPYFKRLRPCHVQSIQPKINIPEGCGGEYGFVSSHAANTFALAMIIILLLKTNYFYSFLVILWSLIVCYSRIYLGAHYPLDVLVGMLVGGLSVSFLYQIFKSKLV